MEILKTLEKAKRKHFTIKNDKIVCTLTGHQMPPSADALLAYAGGKKFLRAVTQRAAELSVPPDHGRYLIDAAQIERGASAGERLFCQLTCRFLANTPRDLARHVAGRRFRTALAAYDAARAEGRQFEPNTSLYKKHRARMTLEGLAGGKGGGGGDGGGGGVDEAEEEEEEDEQADDDGEAESADEEDEEEEEDDDDGEEDDEEEDAEMEGEVEPAPPPPLPQLKRKKNAGVEEPPPVPGKKRRK